MENITAEVAPLTSNELSRLRTILERDEIRRVIEHYARAMDRRDEANGLTTYWEDGYDNHGLFKGNAHDFLSWAMVQDEEVSGMQHILGQSIIEVNGDQASAETYFVFYAELGRTPLANVVNALAGRYVDLFERRNGEWKIANRVVVIDWSSVLRSDERYPGVETFVPGEFYPDDAIFKKPYFFTRDAD